MFHFSLCCRIRYPPFDATKLSHMTWLLTPSSRRFPFKKLFVVSLVVVATSAMLYKVSLQAARPSDCNTMLYSTDCRYLVVDHELQRRTEISNFPPVIVL